MKKTNCLPILAAFLISCIALFGNADALMIVSACGDLNTAGETYVLNQSVSSDGTCFTISADNIIFDGQGNGINYAQVATGYGINIAGAYNNITLRNTVIESFNDPYLYDSYAIHIYQASSVTISNISATTYGDYAYGIVVNFSANTVIEDTNITTRGYTATGIFLGDSLSDVVSRNRVITYGDTAGGIYVGGGNSEILKNNTIYVYGPSDTYGGIYAEYSNNTGISGNRIMNFASYGYGIAFWNNFDSINKAYNNTIVTTSDNSSGIYVLRSDSSIVSDNKITTSGAVAHGVYLDESRSSNISNNNISASGYGMFVYSSSDSNTISGNNITAIGDSGLYIFGSFSNTVSNNIISGTLYGSTIQSSGGNLIYKNYFNNTNNVYIAGPMYENYWNNSLGGNFWAKPDGTGFSQTCTDIGYDGICDESYNITSSNIDYLPLSGKKLQEYTIPMVAGWNLISTPLQPVNTSLFAVLPKQINYTSVWTYYNGSWTFYDAFGPSFLNKLNKVESGRGYWVYMNNDYNLTVRGIPANNVSLIPGWNLVGYNSMTPKNITESMSSINGNYTSVWMYENSLWKFYDLTGPSFLNKLKIMRSGYGYWIYANSTCEWNV